MEQNVIDLDLDLPIYRIFPLSRFRQLRQERQLVLVKPRRWDDPFENFLMGAVGQLPNNELVSFEALRNNLYGQCWMSCAESDAMWRIYSFPARPTAAPGRWRWFHRLVHNFNRWLNGPPTSIGEVGVKVRTTVRKLFTAFYRDHEPQASLCYWIGRVEYLSRLDIQALLQDGHSVTDMLLDQTARGHAQSLLFKREEFSHENEVRLIFDANNGYNSANDLYRFDINPPDLIDEAILDPRLTNQEAHALIQEAQGWGFNKPVTKSALYLSPRYLIGLHV